MQASAQTCGRNKADSMIQNVSYGQYTWIIPHRVVQLLSFWVPGDKATPPTSLLVSSLGSKWSIDTVIHFYFSSFLIHRRALCSQPARGKVCQTGRIFPEQVERSFLNRKHSFITVHQIPWTRFTKQNFTQLRMGFYYSYYVYLHLRLRVSGAVVCGLYCCVNAFVLLVDALFWVGFLLFCWHQMQISIYSKTV